MHCDSCSIQFSVFKRKRTCSECERWYCSACLRRGGGSMCAPCRLLSTRPLLHRDIEEQHLKVRDLQCFLQRQNVSTRGCVEKKELVSLCVAHVNSAAYRRRGTRDPRDTRGAPGPFSTLKGLTTNINKFINSALDRSPAPSPPTRSCYNSAHTHAHATPANNVPPAAPSQPHPERFTTTPGGEADIEVPVPEASASVSRSTSAESARVDTADCYEIEDLDDAGWELLNTPADPLPNDSDVLLSATEGAAARRARELAQAPGGGSGPAPSGEPTRGPLSSLSEESAARAGGAGLSPSQRAASELDLRRPDPAAATAAAADDADSGSLRDEPLGPETHPHSDTAAPVTPKHMSVEQFKSAEELESLSVRQLKELLARSRVEYRGCLERADLLERAKTLWRNHAQFQGDVDSLPIEECCKICMAAPLECVLLECGHIATCTPCAAQLAECPICRRYVVRAVRFFRS